MEIADRVSAGPVHPSPLSPEPGLKSQPAAASAPSYLSSVYCLFHSAISPKLGPPLPSRLMKMGFYWSGSPTSAFIKDMSGAGGAEGEWGGSYVVGLFAVQREEWAAHSGCIFFNCTQLLSTRSSTVLWNSLGKGHVSASQSICSVEVIRSSAQPPKIPTSGLAELLNQSHGCD